MIKHLCFALVGGLISLCSNSFATDFDRVARELRDSGLSEMANLTVAIDFTQSNDWQGTETFGGRSLHDTFGENNPYQVALRAVGNTLFKLDGDHRVTLLGYGDERTKSHSYFFLGTNAETSTFRNVEDATLAYNKVVPRISKSGPTNFAPVIRYVMEQASATRQFQILVIITDGEVEGEYYTADGTLVSCEEETQRAIREASQLPISIIGIGVGDGKHGKFGDLENYDDKLSGRRFDNFNFVKFSKYWEKHLMSKPTFNEEGLAKEAVKELPKQFKEMKRLGILR